MKIKILKYINSTEMKCATSREISKALHYRQDDIIRVLRMLKIDKLVRIDYFKHGVGVYTTDMSESGFVIKHIPTYPLNRKRVYGRPKVPLAKSHVCCNKVYWGNASWTAHKRWHKLTNTLM